LAKTSGRQPKETNVINHCVDRDAAANLLERRWFAAFKAASGVRAECEALLESMALIQSAWSRARARLAALESLRDSLGEELDTLDGRDGSGIGNSDSVMSAA
jgi:hypothetical protein